MISKIVRREIRARVLNVWVLLFLGVVTPAPAFAATAADFRIGGGWFFTQTGGAPGYGYSVLDTGSDSSGHSVAFWTDFQRFGGVPTLGYPVGEPYVAADGFTYQPFQRAVLQWPPELRQAFLTNTFEILSTAQKDEWLYGQKGIPRPIADDGSGGNFQKAVSIRLGWLTNDSIKAYYFANPNRAVIPSWSTDSAIQFYGLPMSQPEQHGPFITQRFQRIALQLWTQGVPNMPSVGTVVGVLGGDMFKEAGQVPANAARPIPEPASTFPNPQLITSIDDPGFHKVQVQKGSGETAFFFETGMRVDADGAPKAYHPVTASSPTGAPPALDNLSSAGSPGHWFGIAVQSVGSPIIQQANDPAPGFYVSTTSLVYPGFSDSDPRRYVDATQIPYFVLPPSVSRSTAGGARLGDLAAVYNRRNGKVAFAIFADTGPEGYIGEGSVALIQALGMPASGLPVSGGQDGQVFYVVYPGSGNGLSRSMADISAIASPLFDAWGGVERIQTMFH